MKTLLRTKVIIKQNQNIEPLKLESSSPLKEFIKQYLDIRRKVFLVQFSPDSTHETFQKNYLQPMQRAYSIGVWLLDRLEMSQKLMLVWNDTLTGVEVRSNNFGYDLIGLLYNYIINVYRFITEHLKSYQDYQANKTIIRGALWAVQQLKSLCNSNRLLTEQCLDLSSNFIGLLESSLKALCMELVLIKRNFAIDIQGYYQKINLNGKLHNQTSKAFFRCSKYLKACQKIQKLMSRDGQNCFKKFNQIIRSKINLYLLKETVMTIRKLSIKDKDKYLPKILRYGHCALKYFQSKDLDVATQGKQFEDDYINLKREMEKYQMYNSQIYKLPPVEEEDKEDFHSQIRTQEIWKHLKSIPFPFIQSERNVVTNTQRQHLDSVTNQIKLKVKHFQDALSCKIQVSEDDLKRGLIQFKKGTDKQYQKSLNQLQDSWKVLIEKQDQMRQMIVSLKKTQISQFKDQPLVMSLQSFESANSAELHSFKQILKRSEAISPIVKTFLYRGQQLFKYLKKKVSVLYSKKSITPDKFNKIQNKLKSIKDRVNKGFINTIEKSKDVLQAIIQVQASFNKQLNQIEEFLRQLEEENKGGLLPQDIVNVFVQPSKELQQIKQLVKEMNLMRKKLQQNMNVMENTHEARKVMISDEKKSDNGNRPMNNLFKLKSGFYE